MVVNIQNPSNIAPLPPSKYALSHLIMHFGTYTYFGSGLELYANRYTNRMHLLHPNDYLRHASFSIWPGVQTHFCLTVQGSQIIECS